MLSMIRKIAASTGLVLLFCLLLSATQCWAQETAEDKNQENTSAGQSSAANEDIYLQQIKPLLAKHCFECHGSQEQSGGLRLDSYKHLSTGGDNGPLWNAKEPQKSLIWQRVTAQEKSERMPPEGEGLDKDELEKLRTWIESGAAGPKQEERDDNTIWNERLKHWAWQPMKSFLPPVDAQIFGPVTSPIDAWVRSKLSAEGLSPAPAAEKTTLLRRLYFDLIGLPPSPDEIEAFLNDSDPNAYGKVVDRLLASPRYGERWARHWLDVVHYGDTHGYDKDKMRPNAWPYRDYVIRAWNEDRPYDVFIKQQIAGDVLEQQSPGTGQTRDNIEALGFISAGPWDFIGHAEVPETKTDGKIARHLDRDNMVATAIGTFSSVTIHCAQCHNHKFDPITQEDYYSLQAVFAAIDRADKSYYADPQIAKQTADLKAELVRSEEQLRICQDKVMKTTDGKLIVLKTRMDELSKSLRENLPPEYGYHSQIASKEDEEKWVQVDLGEKVSIDKLRLHPCYDDFNSIGAGFGFPVRWKVTAADDAEFKQGVVELASFSESNFTNPLWSPVEIDFKKDGKTGAMLRHVRITATRLAKRSNDFIFAIAELEAFDGQGTNIAKGKKVTAKDSIEAPSRWQATNLVDGRTPTGQKGDELVLIQKQSAEIFEKSLDPALRAELKSLESKRKELKEQLDSLPPPQQVYAGTVHTGSGAFRGTGGEGGRPRPIHLLARGNVTMPGKLVNAAALPKLFQLPDFFDLPAEHAESARRTALANWLSHPDHPLTWRSAVNRLWQYHFGRGIVDTPNDFGANGGQPSHPELLDMLALRLRDSQSLKKLQREIVTSASYQQSSTTESELARSKDSENVWLWKQNRRKLEAEGVRDAVLATSGCLDYRMGGPGYQDFVIEHPEHSPHYEYDLADPADSTSFRRSVYRFIVRSQLQPFMTLLDCADPSIRVDRRNETVSATQALTMLNNGFMLIQSKRFAERLKREVGTLGNESMAKRAIRIALGREAQGDEVKVLAEYAERFGWENTCRVLFNLNEFSFVD